MSLITSMMAVGLLHITLLFGHGTYIALVHGIGWGMGRRSSTIDRRDLDRRFERTIANNVESLVAFGVIGAVCLHLELDSLPVAGLTQGAAFCYLLARVGFVAVYLANIPFIRTVFWLIGQGALVVLTIVGIGYIACRATQGASARVS